MMQTAIALTAVILALMENDVMNVPWR